MKIFLVGEGEHELGKLEWDPRVRKSKILEGWMQPILRGLIGDEMVFKTKPIRDITLFPRPAALRPAPHGHGDKAAMAKVLCTIEKCDVVVFAVDADSNVEADRQIKINDIKLGFSRIENAVIGIACVPRSMSESWLLSDPDAWMCDDLVLDSSWPKESPEDLWGLKNDPNGNHPKHVFARVSARARLENDGETRLLVAERTDINCLRQRCPESFGQLALDVSIAKAELAARKTSMESGGAN